MRVTLRQLQIFLAITDLIDGGAIVEEDGVSQLAISAPLVELENLLQQKLFSCIDTRLFLSDSGKVLLPLARQVMQSIDEIEQYFDVRDDNSRDSLKVGASTTIGIYLLPAILWARASQKNTLDRHVTIANTADIAIAVDRGDIDLGLVEGTFCQPNLSFETWINDELIIVCAPQHSILEGDPNKIVSVNALSNSEWLLREPGSGTRESVEEILVPHLKSFKVAGEFSNAEAIKHSTAEGIGLACLSRLVVGDLIDMGKLVQVQTMLPPLYRNFYLVYSKSRVQSDSLKQFLQFCRGWKFDLSKTSRLGDAQRELIRERDDFQHKASIDSLTKSWNRRAITELLAREFARGKRGARMCVAMVDADFFKKVNDTYGHQAGDAVLIEIAKRIKQAIREVDSVGRYGGEEFLVILSDCELVSAQSICERICQFVSGESVQFLSTSINITVSIGLTDRTYDLRRTRHHAFCQK